MKKLATSLLLLGAATAAHAQTSAGTFLLSGSVGYNSNKEERTVRSLTSEQTMRAFRFSPLTGYFVADNLAVGLVGDIQTSRIESPDSYYDLGNGTIRYSVVSKNSSKSIGPFLRYYKMVGEKVAFYGQLSGNYQSGTGSTDSSDSFYGPSKTRTTGFSGTVTPGFVFFPTNKLGLELTMGNLGYSSTEISQEATMQRLATKTKSSGFGTYFGLQSLSIGASLHLGGK